MQGSHDENGNQEFVGDLGNLLKKTEVNEVTEREKKYENK